MYKKRGFSFLEIIIVLMIVSVLFVAFKSIFEVKNKDVFYHQACIESIYGQINNFLHAATSSKAIFSGTTQIFPSVYSISFDPNQEHIVLGYDQETYTLLSINNPQHTSAHCVSDHPLRMTGDQYTLFINKGLQQNTQMKSFFISGTTQNITGSNTFFSCDDQYTTCKEIARFTTDTRTIQIQKQMCIYINEIGECEQRDN